MMKKTVLIAAMVALVFPTNIIAQSMVSVDRIDMSELPKQGEVDQVKESLIEKGYSTEMMNNLFGLDGKYLPFNNEKLESVIFRIDNLIKNEKYDISQKPVLIFLAFDAHRILTNANSTQVSELSIK
jgi:uncharacterized protein YccT (UPF0319 family)